MKYLREFLTTFSLSALTITGCKAPTETTHQYSDERLTINAADGRAIPLRLLTPEDCDKCPLIIFSHGANSSYDRYDKLLVPIAEAGYRVAIPNHTDSEEHPNRSDYQAPNWTPTRLADYTAIATKYETDHLIAAGHSYGALIAQITAGAKLPNLPKMNIPTPKLVIAYSPPGAVPNFFPKTTWDSVTVPSLVTTGTTDIVPMMAERWELHLASYEGTPANLAYALIYDSMDHYMNGAYGRETANQTVERDQAMRHLIESTLFFVESSRTDKPLSITAWETQEKDFVEARANHEQ